jgi:exoribonuclease R
MRAVLHKDRVKVKIIRTDGKGRPEGRVTEIIERPLYPLIGRLLQENGVWLVAPEDKRYGQDVIIPKGATGAANVGQVVVVELTEPPVFMVNRWDASKRSWARSMILEWRLKLRFANSASPMSSHPSA